MRAWLRKATGCFSRAIFLSVCKSNNWRRRRNGFLEPPRVEHRCRGANDFVAGILDRGRASCFFFYRCGVCTDSLINLGRTCRFARLPMLAIPPRCREKSPARRLRLAVAKSQFSPLSLTNTVAHGYAQHVNSAETIGCRDDSFVANCAAPAMLN